MSDPTFYNSRPMRTLANPHFFRNQRLPRPAFEIRDAIMPAMTGQSPGVPGQDSPVKP